MSHPNLADFHEVAHIEPTVEFASCTPTDICNRTIHNIPICRSGKNETRLIRRMPEKTVCRRRTFIAVGLAAASSLGGCVSDLSLDSGGSNEITISQVGITNTLEDPIDVSIVIEQSEEIVLWDEFQLNQSSRQGSDEIVSGPWKTTPGELRVLARYDMVAGGDSATGNQTLDYVVQGGYGACGSLLVYTMDSSGIEIYEPPTEAEC